MTYPVAQLNPSAHRPMLHVTADFQFGVLRTDPGNEAQLARNRMAVANIDDIDINLAARGLRKLKKLKGVNDTDLIATPHHVAIPALEGEFVAIDQSIRRIVKVCVAETDCHCDRGKLIDRLHAVENRGVCESGNVSDRTELAAAKEMGTGQTTPLSKT